MDRHDPAVEQVDDTQIIEPARNGSGAHSVIEALRAKREAHAAPRSVDLEVPGYGDMLVLRCGPIPGAQLNRLAERGQSSKSRERALEANADMLVAACHEVWGRKVPGGELFLIDDDEGEPMRLDKRLASALGLQAIDGSTPERARAVVLSLFSQAPVPEMAIGAAATEYVEWATAANAEIDEELLGES